MLKYLLVLFIGILALSSCRQDPGFGGNSTIIGRLKLENYNTDYTLLRQSYYPANEDVYILFGSNSAYGDRVKTDIKGFFEFKNLNPGTYTIYAYSKDSSRKEPSGYIPIQKTIEITNNHELIDIGELVTLDNDDDGFATIRGKVLANEGGVSYYAPDERVYLTYPNSFGIETSQRTKFDGTFEFRNLPLGTYTIYAYSKDSQAPSGVSPIIQTVVIDSSNQETFLPDLVINL
ncbi:collagen binding domain-containing protein [Aureispira sp. CCB-QB1]|uniref:MSCRAMM family protein n=1 Tax=Aureispira sp. CCB-QB1 TaxID=1313421 RepID=UPI000696B46F|nr:hypothetical protein [Aureispira sp. CCB-QB1]